jgi:hypothetical protein
MAILQKGVTGQILLSVNRVDFINQTEIFVTHYLNKNVLINVLDQNGEYITSAVEIDVISSNQFRVRSSSLLSGTILYS